jgi:DNA-binding GntR family transcriptional regulator
MLQLLESHALKLSIARADLDWVAPAVGARHELSKFEELAAADPGTYGELWERANQEFHEALVSNCSRLGYAFICEPFTTTAGAIACSPSRIRRFRALNPR